MHDASRELGAELGAQATSLRRLARDLLRDAHFAEDAVQEAMVAAVERPPRSRSGLTAWLRTVVSRCALDLRRGERRRRVREQVVARGDRDAPTVVQVELQQRVLAAVQALGEPYRTVVWRRYYEGQSPREIAVALDEPVKTVKTRLWRALAQLRQRLDAGTGGRGAWVGALAPFAASGKSIARGVFVMSTQGKIVGVAAAMLAAVVVWGWLAAPAASALPPPFVPPLAANATSDVRGAQVSLDAGTREQPEAQETAPPPPWGLPFHIIEPKTEIAGVVLDVNGHGIAGVRITRERARFVPDLTTDANGRFAGPGSTGGTFGVDDERWVAVLVPMMSSEQPHDDLTIVVAPCTRVAGRVVDAAGQPIVGVRVQASGGAVVREHFARVLDRCADALWEQTTVAGGAFAFPRVPLVDAAKLTIEERGYRRLAVPMAVARTQEVFVLERKFEGDTLAGFVVDEQGAPARGAVALHNTSVEVRADGAFQIELWRVGDLPANTKAELVGTSPGRLPARLACASPDWRSRAAWPSPLYLRVGGVPETIRGRLLRADGTPCANATPSFVAPEPDHALAPLAEERAPIDAEAGEFETAAVTPGRHRLWFVDPITLDMIVTEPLPTGAAPVTLRFPDRGHWPALRGVIVDRHGAPVRNADWQLERDDPLPDARGPRASTWGHAGADGRIDSAPPSRDVHTLCVKDDGASDWLRIPLASLARVDDFRIVVPVRCRARIDLTGSWPGVDGAQFVDAAGAISKVVFTTATMAYGVSRIPLVESGDAVETRTVARGASRAPLIGGRSRSFTALDDAVELRLFRGAQQVGALPVALQRGADNVVRP